jgi:hypothetical protein
VATTALEANDLTGLPGTLADGGPGRDALAEDELLTAKEPTAELKLSLQALERQRATGPDHSLLTACSRDQPTRAGTAWDGYQ